MTSHWYAIADAGGNIYPHSFRANVDSARVCHVIRTVQESDPQLTSFGVDYVEQRWRELVESCGDHIVKCVVETNETVKVISKEAI